MNGRLILLVEDMQEVQNYNKRMLEDEGFAVETAMTLADARAVLARKTPEIIVLDRGMPDGEGADFLRTLRAEGNKIPVLLLTGYGESTDVVEGFKSGCDDYLTKPYTFDVLLVRLERLLNSAGQVPQMVRTGSLQLAISSHQAFLNGKNMGLSVTEFFLLLYFTQNERKTTSAECLYESIWGQPMNDNNQAVRTAVSRLRTKLKGSEFVIDFEWSEGYRFCKVK